MFGKDGGDPRSGENPVARHEGMSATVSGNETLVYDREKFVIHRLSAEHAEVWKLADGTRTLDQLAHDASKELGGGEILPPRYQSCTC